MIKAKTNFEGQTVFVGMDIQKYSWNLGIHLNDQFIRNVHQKPKSAHHGPGFTTAIPRNKLQGRL